MIKLILSLCVALGLAACGDKNTNESVQADTKPVVKFAALYPLSGDGAQYGETAQKVAKMFFDDFHQKFPHSKYDYQVIFEDVQWAAAKTASAVKKVIDFDKVSAVFAISSSQGMVINPVAEDNHVIQLSYAVDPSVAKGKYNFTISTSISKIADMMIEKMKQHNVKKVAFITLASDMASVKVAQEVSSRLEQNMMENVGEYLINSQETDFAIMLEKIRRDSPDIIVFEALPPTGDLVLRRMKLLNINIPVTGIWTITTLNDKSLAEGSWFVDDGEATQEFVDEYNQKIDTKGTHYGEYMYTILTVLTNAFENTPAPEGQIPDTSDVVATIMNQTKGMESALGILDINEAGEIGLSGTYKRVKDGQIIIEEKE